MLLKRGSIIHSLVSYAYWRLPRALRKASIIRELCYLLFRDPCKVMQIGANDGRHNDPIYDFLSGTANEALLIEPHPLHFSALQNTYRDSPGVLFLNAGIGADSDMTLYSTPERQGIESFEIEHLHRLLPKSQHSTIEETVVNCISFETLLNRYENFNSVDLLLIDAEGMDVDIVSTIDMSVFSTRVLIFEAKNCRDLKAVTSLEQKLRRADFSVGYESGECIAIHRAERSPRVRGLIRHLDSAAFDSRMIQAVR